MCKYEELKKHDGIEVGQTVIFSFGGNDSIKSKVRIKNIYKDESGTVNFLFKTPMKFHKWWKKKSGELYIRVMSTVRSELEVIS